LLQFPHDRIALSDWSKRTTDSSVYNDKLGNLT
jgi:hypothetical protein